jgi:hypothetical protein
MMTMVVVVVVVVMVGWLVFYCYRRKRTREN